MAVPGEQSHYIRGMRRCTWWSPGTRFAQLRNNNNIHLTSKAPFGAARHIPVWTMLLLFFGGDQCQLNEPASCTQNRNISKKVPSAAVWVHVSYAVCPWSVAWTDMGNDPLLTWTDSDLCEKVWLFYSFSYYATIESLTQSWFLHSIWLPWHWIESAKPGFLSGSREKSGSFFNQVIAFCGRHMLDSLALVALWKAVSTACCLKRIANRRILQHCIPKNSRFQLGAFTSLVFLTSPAPPTSCYLLVKPCNIDACAPILHQLMRDWCVFQFVILG